MPITKNELNNCKKNLTVDHEHSKILNNIEREEKVIPKYDDKINKLQKLLNSETNIEKKLELQDEITNVKAKKKEIKNKKKLYLLDNSRYIFEYFERKKKISNCNDNSNNIIKNNSQKDLNTFFYNENSENNEPNENSEKFINKDTNLDKYFNNITSNITNLENYYLENDTCKYCNEGEFIFIENEGLMVCNKCSKTKKLYIENDKPSYREPPKEVCFYAYKRINHLREILAQFQAKETTQIPEEVINNIKNQLKKERITTDELTNKKTKEILKNLKYNKYYEHIPYIKEKLGIKPPVMSQELEEKLCNLFIEIQTPYSRYCPKERVNFLNYYYTIYKLCELLGEHKFLPYFPMLKDREKRMEQDNIWKKICEELNWEFIPTI